MAYKKVTVPMLDAISLAVAVYEQAGRTIKRWDGTEPGNKEMVVLHYDGTRPINVTDAHKERAEEIVQFLKHRLLMQVLGSKTVNGFFGDICKIVENDTVNSSQFGILVWAPKLHDDMTGADKVKESIEEVCANSQYLGDEGKSIQLTVHIMDSFYLRNFAKYKQVAHDGAGNLVVFYNTNKLESGSKIKARVKKHYNNEQYRGIKATALNYVKVQ